MEVSLGSVKEIGVPVVGSSLAVMDARKCHRRSYERVGGERGKVE